MSRVRDLADNNVVFVDGITTADITEHTNLFFTDARADARLALKMVDEDNMSSNSAAHMPTQQSVKAYVDTEVASLVDSSPGTLDTLNELAAALGDDPNFSTTVTTSIATKLPLAGGTMTGNIAHTGNFTIDIAGYLDLDVDDGGSVYFSDGGVTFGRIFGTNSDLYIKSQISEKDIIFQGVDGGTAMTALILDMSDAGTAHFNHNITLPDNGKAIFGAGSDLQIYHDGFNSFIVDQGTGDLAFRGSALIGFQNSAGTENYANFNDNGAVNLYHDNSLKFATTSTGVDITGTVTSDGLTVQSNNYLDIHDADNHVSGRLRNVSGSNNALAIEADPNNSASDSFINFKIDTSEKMRIRSTGHVEFNPVDSFSGLNNSILGSSNGYQYFMGGANGLYLADNANLSNAIGIRDAGFLDFITGGTGEKMRITSTGNVGIGTTSPSRQLEIFKAGEAGAYRLKVKGDTDHTGIQIENTAVSNTNLLYTNPNHSQELYMDAAGAFHIYNNSTHRFTVLPSGNVGIGKTGPATKLDVAGTVTADQYNTDAALPTIRPTLNCDFANSKTLDDRFTFTRGSTATYYDGKTFAKADENLLKYSTDLSNGYYTQRGFNQLSSTELAPDGTNTAFKFQENNTNSNPAILPASNVAGSGQNTFSVYLKADSNTNIYLSTDGATLQTQFTVTTTWQRFQVTANNTPRFHVGGFGTVTQGGGQTFYMWGPQQEYGSSATNYTPTTSSAITTYQPKMLTAPANKPRFDHDPFTGESKGLLIEQSHTNVAHYSTGAFNATTGNTTRYTNQGVAPDGTNTATAIMATPGTGGSGYAYGGATNWIGNTGSWTLSYYYKRVWGTATINVGRGGSPGNIYAYVNSANVVSGGVSGSMTLVSAHREDIGNGWYRAVVTATSSSSTPGYGESQAFPAGGNSKYLVWGLQLENQDFASSYIPTSGSSVTRSQDSVSMGEQELNTWYTNPGDNTDNGGTYLYEWKTKGIVGSNDWGLLWRNASNGNRFGMYEQSGGNVYSEFAPSGTEAALDTGTASSSNYNVLATAFAKNDIASSLNSGTAVIDTTCHIPNNTNTFYLGWYSAGNGLSAHVKRFTFWPERLSNDTLKEITKE